jgi:cholesterol oxidase
VAVSSDIEAEAGTDGRIPIRLSSRLDELSPDQEVVIVGSGYGGAIMACRLARAGQSVVVLERGPERHPGEFADRLADAARDVQVRTRWGRLGSPTALFDVRLSQGQSVLVGCGLGGTSLINANVSLRSGADVFDDDRWPEALRGDAHHVLDPFYERAEHMLGARLYPDGWPRLPKLDALAAGALALGGTMVRAPINVSFSAGANAVGLHQDACTLCGDCCSGCNVGAKNTVLTNYLPDAHAHDARIFTQVAVQRVRRDGARWLVDVMAVGSGRGHFRASPLVISADIVVLAAGTLGSTEILMRSRQAGLRVSDQLGERFNGNGDVLGFAHDTTSDVDAVGWGATHERHPVGPTITGRIPLFDTGTGDEVTVEEGSIPGVLTPVVPLAVAVATLARRDLGLVDRLRLAARSVRRASRRTLTYLVMSTDDGDGRMRLGRGGIQVDWEDVGEAPVFASDNQKLKTAAEAIGGHYLAQPMWSKDNGFSLITVHPLGGCVMADDAERGVVDDRGRVFAGPTGREVHDGLIVADGSIVPRPLDVNPLLTISALAERAADALVKDRGWVSVEQEMSPLRWADPAPGPAAGVDTEPGRAPVGSSAQPRLWFTERMIGWLAPPQGVTLAPAWTGRPTGSGPIEFVLTIASEDVPALLADAATPMTLVGTVEAPALAPGPLMVEHGELRLLEPVSDQVETWHMHYAIDLVAGDGRRFHFDGIKVIRHGPPWMVWRETSTLYVTITDESGDRVGVGVMRIRPSDFARQLTTMRVSAAGGPLVAMRCLVGFLRLFLGRLFHLFGGLPAELELVTSRDDPHDPENLPVSGLRPSLLPEPEICWSGRDGTWHDVDVAKSCSDAALDATALVETGKVPVGPDAHLMLTRYCGGTKGPVLLAPGFAMAARSFLGRTMPVNLTEYLVGHGYDVWLFDYRASIDLPSCRTDFTIDEIATLDWPAAVAEVRARTDADSVQAFGHCVGSSSLLMALGAGMEGVRSAVCSQFSLHPHTSLLNRVKCVLRVGKVAHDIGIRGVLPDNEHLWIDIATTVALHLVPVPRQEHCGEPDCRFINSVYGCTHTHAQLDNATHHSLHGAFGYGNTTTLGHLALMMRRRLAVDAQGCEVYTQHPERLALPLHFLAGARNYIFKPAGTQATLDWLRTHNDPELYSCSWLAEYAHLDAIIGRDAAVDVFPSVLAHLDATNRKVPNG